MHLSDLGLAKRLVMLSNGQEVIDYCDKLYEDLYRSQTEGELPLQPVALLLLDINMPIKNGIETLLVIKEKFK